MVKQEDLQVINACANVQVSGEFASIEQIQRNIIKKYRKQLWSPFIKGVEQYQMLRDGDVIGVCISGGKDSLLLAKMMQELQRHSKYDIKLEFIAMNPGFNEINLKILKNSCEKMGIDVKIFETEIFAITQKIAAEYPCFMCAKMRRGALYNFAKELGCNKIALGHHFDDVIETTMINMLYGGKVSTMMPKLKATNPDNFGLELIRPMFLVRESDIIKFTKEHNIQAMNCGCVVTAKKTSSKRSEVKKLLEQLRIINPEIDKSIFASMSNINMNTILGWKIDNEKHDFLETYDEK